MRKDENGNECPSTLGEYRKMCVALAGENNKAVALLDSKIADQGEAEIVETDDLQMRMLLMPLMIQPKEV